MGVTKIKPSKFLKLLFLNKNMKTGEVAEKMGKSVSNVTGILRNETMNIKTLQEIMKACDEPLVIVLSNGERFEFELNQKQ
jgi:transcriptional regulator with XRE-family HTH domain